MEEARDRLITPDQTRKDFYAHERLIRALYDAIKPDPAVLEFASTVSCIATIVDMIRIAIGGGAPPDISTVLTEINTLLDKSITSEGFVIQETRGGKPLPLLDLSKIDFAALAKIFEKSKHKSTELERLKAAIQAQLERMIRLNPTRTNYTIKFEELIDSYNNGSRNIEQLFQELLKLTKELSDEDQSHIRENLSVEEKVVFDILTRPGPNLAPAERDEVKKVARDLLNRIKTLLVLNWRQRSQSRAQIRLAIEDTLDDGLPRAYTPDLYTRKVSALFEHLYERYPGEGAGIYDQLGKTPF
jgi:type I restriction enzyme R subunit